MGDKSPGPDGFPMVFSKHVSTFLNLTLWQCFKAFMRMGNLS